MTRKRVLVLATALVGMVACGGGNGGNPTAPSLTMAAATSNSTSATISTLESPVAVVTAQGKGWEMHSEFPQVCIPLSDILAKGKLEWVLRLTDVGEGLHLQKAAYESTVAGCGEVGPSQRAKPAFSALQVEGKMQYRKGETGETKFSFRMQDLRSMCGAWQGDASIVRPDGSMELVLGVVIDSGKDCPPPTCPPGQLGTPPNCTNPPAPPPPLPPITPPPPPTTPVCIPTGKLTFGDWIEGKMPTVAGLNFDINPYPPVSPHPPVDDCKDVEVDAYRKVTDSCGNFVRYEPGKITKKVCVGQK